MEANMYQHQFDLRCGICEKRLKVMSTKKDVGCTRILLEPCPNCLSETTAKRTGKDHYKNGYGDGYEEGLEDGERERKRQSERKRL